MSADPLSFLDSDKGSSDPLSFLDKSAGSSSFKNQFKGGFKSLPSLKKGGRLGAQYAIGAAETALLPYELAVAPTASKDAQHAEYRKELFADIERLQEQKASGDWSPQDQELYDDLLEQVKSPEKAEKNVKTADIGVGSLIEKGAEQFGVDLRPEDTSEHVARIGGNIVKPKTIGKFATKGVSMLTAEGRVALKEAKVASKWKSLANSAKGDAEKEGLLNFAQFHQMSPEAANLLIQSKGKVETLGKIAKKTKKFKAAVQELKDKLGNSYEELKKIGAQGGPLGQQQTEKLSGELRALVGDMGKTLVEGPDTKAARTAIEEAIHRLEIKGATVEDLINSRLNLGQSINWKNVDPKGEMLNRARKIFVDAIERSNPGVAHELRAADKGWRKYKDFQKILDKKGPKISFKGVEIPNFAAGAALIYAFGTGKAFAGMIGKEVVQRVATKLLLDPKYQQLHKKLVGAVTSGATEKQKEILITVKKMLKKDDPELYDELSGIVFE